MNIAVGLICLVVFINNGAGNAHEAGGFEEEGLLREVVKGRFGLSSEVAREESESDDDDDDDDNEADSAVEMVHYNPAHNESSLRKEYGDTCFTECNGSGWNWWKCPVGFYCLEKTKTSRCCRDGHYPCGDGNALYGCCPCGTPCCATGCC